MVQKSIGRPLSFDPKQALTSALETFWRLGYDASSLPDLERATGLARSSLYNRFGDKRELFLAALAAYAQAIGNELAQPLERGASGLDDLLAFFDQMERHTRDPQAPGGCLIVNSLVEIGDTDPDVHRIVSAYLDRLRSAFATALRRASALGEVDGDAVVSRADVLLALVIGISAACRGGEAYGLPLLAAARGQVEEWRR